jgi:hypothetical protein
LCDDFLHHWCKSGAIGVEQIYRSLDARKQFSCQVKQAIALTLILPLLQRIPPSPFSSKWPSCNRLQDITSACIAP